jgi:DNA polymerase-3 subunit delta'
MAFADIHDQEVPIRLLRNIMRQGRIPHGLLFWGPDGVGKRLTAREFVKALNCARRDGNGDACGVCLPCRKVESGNHPDLSITAPKKRARIINVEDVEDITALAALRPYEGVWRAFLLLDADRMGVPAQNKLLKTLEEPPGHSVFILVTEHPKQLLPTIRSRCQQMRFGALRPETVAALLQAHRDVDAEAAAALAAVSQGQVSRALDLVDTDRRGVVLGLVQRLQDGEDPLLLSEEFAAHLAAVKAGIEAELKADDSGVNTKEMTKEDREALEAARMSQLEARMRRDIMEYLYLLETWYRDAMVFRATGALDHVLNRDEARRLAATPDADYGAKLGAIEQTRVYLERFLNEGRVFRDLFFVLAA